MLKKVKSVFVLYFICVIVIVFGCVSPVYAINPKKNIYSSVCGNKRRI